LKKTATLVSDVEVRRRVLTACADDESRRGGWSRLRGYSSLTCGIHRGLRSAFNDCVYYTGYYFRHGIIKAYTDFFFRANSLYPDYF